jgi:CheY-like chemotaxis protein
MCRVLVIDDSDDSVRSTLKTMLESVGHDVAVAFDGVAQFRERSFDLVISDIVMPRRLPDRTRTPGNDGGRADYRHVRRLSALQ